MAAIRSDIIDGVFGALDELELRLSSAVSPATSNGECPQDSGEDVGLVGLADEIRDGNYKDKDSNERLSRLIRLIESLSSRVEL